ncbi:MAG: hypothetical protein FWF28_04430, partial [Micrococcales bacterium]|nr:hypothetical protein [Micrococcales bacterium]
VRDALLDWAGGLTRRHVPELLGPGQAAAVAVLVRDQENLLFALRVAAQKVAGVRARRPDVVVWVSVGLGASWGLRGAEDRAAGFAPTLLDALVAWPVPPPDADVTAVALMLTAAAQAMTDATSTARALARLRRVLRERPVSARTRAIATVLMLPDRTAFAAVCSELLDASDPLVAFAARLAAGQGAENDGRLVEARRLAEAAYEQALRVGDVATPALAAMFVASAASELGDFATAVTWTARARGPLVRLGSRGALWQGAWVELSAALGRGDLAEAERLCDVLEHPDDETGAQGGIEMRLGAGAGRCEIAWARGDVDGALARYRDLARAFDEATGPAMPWTVMLGTARLVRLVQAGRRREASETVTWLTGQVAHLYRQWTQFLDRPVLGAACVGVGAYVTGFGGAVTAGEDDVGDLSAAPDGPVAIELELFALAEALGSRQDVVAVTRAPLLAAATARHGMAALDEARARVAAMTREDLAERALALLAEVREEGEATG